MIEGRSERADQDCSNQGVIKLGVVHDLEKSGGSQDEKAIHSNVGTLDSNAWDSGPHTRNTSGKRTRMTKSRC
jgi:hypothetical protein